MLATSSHKCITHSTLHMGTASKRVHKAPHFCFAPLHRSEKKKNMWIVDLFVVDTGLGIGSVAECM